MNPSLIQSGPDQALAAAGGLPLPVVRSRVVVADDDPDLRRLIAQALATQGFEVLVAADGAQLLDLVAPSLLGVASEWPTELVISDLRMPGVTGLSVLAGLREMGARLPFIIITGFGDPETHEAARRSGATAVLDKPFEMSSLLALVRACLAI